MYTVRRLLKPHTYIARVETRRSRSSRKKNSLEKVMEGVYGSNAYETKAKWKGLVPKERINMQILGSER
jgi:hypothetical protein